jgi:hypothetical protein
MRRFTATMDSLAKTLTFALLMVLVIPFYTIIRQYFKLDDIRMLIGPAVVTIGVILVVLYRPKGYALDKSVLRILRQAGPLDIPLRSIRSIMPVTSKELGFGIFGTGGFFGYFGPYIYQNHGKVAMYATDKSKMLLLTLDDERRIVISPDDPEGFMTAFRELKR